MRKKVVKEGKKVGSPCGPRKKMTSEELNQLLKDRIDHSLHFLSQKYHRDRDTIKKILDQNPLPTQITAREELDPLKRTELLAKDSAKVLELTIFSMQKLLEKAIEANKLDPETKPTITVKDLKDFFETVAPYVLQKIDSTPAKKGEKTPMAKVHNMFAKKSIS